MSKPKSPRRQPTQSPAWALVLVVLVCGCGVDHQVTGSLENFSKSVTDYEQGCSWRVGVADFRTRDPGACWHVLTDGSDRLSSFELADVCDAPKLPQCVALHGTEMPTAYYDRTKTDKYREVRYEKVETLSDGTCAPCEEP